jgi:hypothetical protein
MRAFFLSDVNSTGAQTHQIPVVRMFSILYISGRSVRNAEHYEITIIKTSASAGQTDLKKIRC